MGHTGLLGTRPQHMARRVVLSNPILPICLGVVLILKEAMGHTRLLVTFRSKHMACRVVISHLNLPTCLAPRGVVIHSLMTARDDTTRLLGILARRVVIPTLVMTPADNTRLGTPRKTPPHIRSAFPNMAPHRVALPKTPSHIKFSFPDMDPRRVVLRNTPSRTMSPSPAKIYPHQPPTTSTPRMASRKVVLLVMMTKDETLLLGTSRPQQMTLRRVALCPLIPPLVVEQDETRACYRWCDM